MKSNSKSSTTGRFSTLAAAMLCTLVVGGIGSARANENERYRSEIEVLKITNLTSLAAGIVTPPPFDLIPESIEYSTGLLLKAVPAVLEAPETVRVDPNTMDGCGFDYRYSRHNGDPVFDYENIYGIDLPLNNGWGLLGAPRIEHFNTGGFGTIRRQLTQDVPDPAPNYPERMRRVDVGERLLFARTNDRSEFLNAPPGALRLDNEYFPIGVTNLTWETENKLDVIFDALLTPALFGVEKKYTSKFFSVRIAPPPRFGRPWARAANSFMEALPRSYRSQLLQNAAFAMIGVGLSADGSALQQLTNTELLSYPIGVFNRKRQVFIVNDNVPPVVEVTRQPDVFEANTLGGEFGLRHFDDLYSLLRVSDKCNRPVKLDTQPRGTRFWPLGDTQLQWCGRDPGGNETCADILVRVVDTRPPLVLPPPSLTVVSQASAALDVGWAGVFDVADPEVVVTNDAPAVFPVGRTPITWRAEDSSGNTASATQWVNVKPANQPPQGLPQGTVAARSFEDTRIELAAEDGDLLDGRYDQLSFRISEPPADGFFVAPLFPFFIEDHRQHRINPDGTYTSYIIEAQAACPGTEPDRSVIVEPVYVTVTDDDVMYVMDSYFECQTGGGTRRSGRIAKFSPSADGALEFEAQFEVGRLGGDNDRHLFIDHREQLWYVQRNSDGIHGPIIALDKDLNRVQTIFAAELTEINPVTGRVQTAFGERNTAIQAVAVDRNDVLYVSNGAKILSYDLQRRQPDNPGQYLRLSAVAAAPDTSVVDVTAVEPWASYYTLLSGGYTDLVLDSDDNLYVSDGRMSRVWKFQATRLSKDREEIDQAPDLVGWMGACNENLDANVLACRTDLGRSEGFSCQDDLCGPDAGVEVTGGGQGEFNQPRGIAMSPQNVLYVTDTGNRRVQRFTTDGFFAGEAVSECGGSCFVLGDFGFVTNVTVNSNFFYLLDTDNDITHVFETTPITDVDDQTMEQTQSAFVTYRSNDNYVGPDAFDFIAYDGLEFSAPQRVDIDVRRNFRAPIATPGLAFSGNEDEAIPLQLTGLDPDDDTLDFEIEVPPEHGTIVRVGAGLEYRPNPDFFGSDSFAFVASDAPTSNPALRSAPETVAVTVVPVNDAPEWQFEALGDQGVGFSFQLKASLKDVDLDDTHRIAIQWGDGVISTNNSDDVYIGSSPGNFSVIADHVYGNTGDFTITLCASEAQSAMPLSCASPDVTASASLNVNVSEMVDLHVDIEDSLPKTSDPDIPEIGLSDPLLDGGDRVTYSLTVTSTPPVDESEPLATGVQLTFDLASSMELFSINTDAGNCTFQVPRVTCSLGDLPAGGAAQVDVTASGNGKLFEEVLATSRAVVTANERDHSGGSEGAIQTRLTVNPALDADGDGVSNAEDAFPGDASESADTDGDGVGNNADRDDDGDGLPDAWERRFGFDPLGAGEAVVDTDSDGLSNEFEFMLGTHPGLEDSDRDGVGDGEDNCPVTFNRNQFDENEDLTGDLCDPRSFAASIPAGDLDGDGVADVALLRTESAVTTVFVKSGDSDNDIAVFQALSDPDQPEALVSLPGGVAGESHGAALVYSDATGGIHARVFETETGSQVADFAVLDADRRFLGAASAPDANGAALLVLSVTQDERIEVAKHDPEDGTLLGQASFLSNEDAALTFGALDASTVVVLAVDSQGGLVAQARDIDAGTEVGNWSIESADWVTAKLALQPDQFTVMTTRADGVANVSVWQLNEAQPVSQFDVLDEPWTAIDFSFGFDDASTIAVLAGNAAGDVQARLFDPAMGAEINSLDYLSAAEAPWSLQTLASQAAGAAARIGVLASDAGGQVHLQQRNAVTGESLTTLTAASVMPAPPPAPPSPGPTGGSGGGGGGALVWLLLLLLRGFRRSAPPGFAHILEQKP